MWWVVSLPSGNKVHWRVEFGTKAYVEGRFPTAAIYGPYNSRSSAQRYVNQQQGKPVRKRKNNRRSTPSGAYIVSLARSWLGVPYLYGGTNRRGVDCSGLVMNVCQEAGVKSCPRTSEEQWAWCNHITQSEAGPGDLVFFIGAEIDPPPGHVGIMVAPNRMINAATTGTVVREDTFADGPGPDHIIGYGRIPGVNKSTTANPYMKGSTKVPAEAGTVIGASVMPVVLIAIAVLFVVVLFLVLIAAGLLFRR